MGDRLRILFLCAGDSCRGRMAEGWARRLRDEIRRFVESLPEALDCPRKETTP